MTTKSMTIKSMDDAGTGLARIAILSAIDHDEDTYLPGAFAWKAGAEQWVQIIPAHDRQAMPFGKARIFEQGDEVLAELHLNLETQAGKEWHAALKFDLANGNSVQEWSYGFNVIDAVYEVRSDSRVRVLKKLDVYEISPVLRGAGVGTGTLSLKGLKGVELKEAHFAPLIAGLGELAAALPDDLGVLSATGLKQLTDIRDKVTAALDQIEAKDADEQIASDTALAGYLLHLTRSHHRLEN